MSLPIKIKLPERFLETEVRCGYEVSSRLKKIWAVELDLLAEFDRVCRKHDIKYQVFAGTLLGAVRHRGFIPWDDDVDVAMSRCDYEKLLSVSNEFEHPYFLQTPYNDTKFFSAHSRLRNCETTGALRNQLDVNYNNGIYIDVFTLDGFTASKTLYFAQKMAIRAVTSAIVNRKGCDNDGGNKVKAIFKAIISSSFGFLTESSLLKVRDWLVRFFNRFECGRVGLVSHINWFTDKYWLLDRELECTNEYQFETISVPGPADYDAVLTRIYGKYMEFPPQELRGNWHNGKILFDPDTPYKQFIRDISERERMRDEV